MIDGGDASEEGSGQALSDEQLQTRNISTETLDQWQQNFYRFGADVIDRVWLEGVVKVATNITIGLTPRPFRLLRSSLAIPSFPNRWRKRKSDAEAAAQYSGLAGYARATRLDGTENQIVVECHLVAYEPTDWFNGPNLLSSKLPIVTQDAVRKFRRALAKSSLPEK